VHRNIANTVHADDINAASVVEYAVTFLKVKKVVVCGHTKCGGANAALGDADLGQTLNTWLHPVREYVADPFVTCKCRFPGEQAFAACKMQMLTVAHFIRLRRKHKTELESLPDDDARSARVAELNVQQSIEVLKQHPAIKRAVGERGLMLHGLIYDIGAGELKILGEKGSKKANGLWTPN
jgi:carbonic anhydrase